VVLHRHLRASSGTRVSALVERSINAEIGVPGTGPDRVPDVTITGPAPCGTLDVTSSRARVLWGRCNSEPAVKVRDPVTASDRLTRCNSWTDGESPDGKSMQDVEAARARPASRRPPAVFPPPS